MLNSKLLFPEYKSVQSQVLQDCVERVKKTFERWMKGDSKGKRSGRPRFKGKGRYRSFTFPQVKQDCISGKHIKLPVLGELKLILHRPLPDGFKITADFSLMKYSHNLRVLMLWLYHVFSLLEICCKTATITQKTDGWYVILSLEDLSVPELQPLVPTLENTVGIDLGLKTFLVTNEGEEVAIPRHYHKSEKHLKRLQRRLSRKKKGSNRRKKAVKRVANAHLKIANQRKDFHDKTANNLISKGKNIGHEDLNIKGIAKTNMVKSTHDAGWGMFLQVLKVKAERAGFLAIAVNPSGTTQRCSGCGERVPKTLSDRWHSCPCGVELDRDLNAAINIRNLAVGHSVNQALGVRCTLQDVEERSPRCTVGQRREYVTKKRGDS